MTMWEVREGGIKDSTSHEGKMGERCVGFREIGNHPLFTDAVFPYIYIYICIPDRQQNDDAKQKQ